MKTEATQAFILKAKFGQGLCDLHIDGELYQQAQAMKAKGMPSRACLRPTATLKASSWD